MEYLQSVKKQNIHEMTTEEIKLEIANNNQRIRELNDEERELKQQNDKLHKSLFDSIVRKVIDAGFVHMKCRHRNVKVNKNREQDELDRMRREAEMRLWTTGGRTPSLERGIFYGQCQECGVGINKHDCSIEGETYYFTCDEARVINNVARQHGISGSIHTATQIQD